MPRAGCESSVIPGTMTVVSVPVPMRYRPQVAGVDVDHNAKLNEPDEVAAAVESALSEPKPKLRYMVVPNAEQAQYTIKTQIEQLVQLNEGQPYTYDRAALIKMLDTALVGTRPRSK